MPSQSLNFNISYTIDSSLIWSVEEYLVNFLTGIPLRGLGGQKLSDTAIEKKIRVSTSQIEGMLDVKISKQRLRENYDFEKEHFQNWGAIKVNYPISNVNELRGQLNFAHQITYPQGWISLKRQIEKVRNLYIVAGQQEDLTGLKSDFVAVFTGKFPIFGYSNAGYIPNYWVVDYTSGFEDVPDDIQDAIGKIATMQILAILGDIAFGAGIANTSLSIDGLSQSIGTTQSAENSLYSARVRQFERELKIEIKALKSRYRGVQFASL